MTSLRAVQRALAIACLAVLSTVALAKVEAVGEGRGQKPAPVTPSGGDQQLYIGTYAGSIQIFDESSEAMTGEIKLKTGIPRSLTLSQSRTKFYVLDSTLEKIEIVDIPTRAMDRPSGRTSTTASGFAAGPTPVWRSTERSR